MLKLQEHRLLLWAQKSGLIDDKLDPRYNEPLIHEVLAQLRNLLSDTRHLNAKYKLEITPVAPDTAEIPAGQPWGPPLGFLDKYSIVQKRKEIVLRARAAQKASWFQERPSRLQGSH